MKKSILIASPYFPYPLSGGGQRALYNEIDALRTEYQIILVCPFADKSIMNELQNIWKNVEIRILSNKEVLPVKSFTNVLAKFLISGFRKNEKAYFYDERFYKTYFSILYEFNEKWYTYVNEIIISSGCDIVQTEFFPLLNNIIFLPGERLRIFVHHEIGFIKLKRNLDLTGLPLKYQESIVRCLNDLEVHYLNQYDKIITLSETDKQFLSKNGVTKEIIASPFPYMSIVENANAYSFNNNLVLLGGESNFPNADGLQWFLEVIWPTVLNTYENLQLKVIGRWSDRARKRFSHKNVQFVGYIGNLNEYIRNTILIVPIRIGSGIRVKILDALSAGVPVISTSIGAEGLEGFMKDMFIADNREEFLLEIQKIIDNQKEIAMKIQGVNNKVRQVFSNENFQKTREAVYG